MKISNTKLTLLTHISIAYLTEGKNILQSYFIESQNLCIAVLKDPVEHNPVSSYCDHNLKLIDKEMRNTDKKHKMLQNLLGFSNEWSYEAKLMAPLLFLTGSLVLQV